MLKIVLDTNVFVSSLLSKHGAPAQVLTAWRNRHFLLCCSPAIVREVQRVLAYPKLRDKYQLTTAHTNALLELLRHDTFLVSGETVIAPTIPNDPTDEIFLICALEAAADLIVSGDRHLLELGTYANIPIVTVTALLERLGGNVTGRDTG
ncbi:MAG TPA: putative toxin-antitoxin system toxin component, PIN family [Thermoflexia bacterium]|nr:putative toxin-antitoxin system toxin component, PIN family [Thermoflexia bacterium]